MGIDLGDGYNIGKPNKMEIVPNMILTFHPSLLDKNGEGVLYADTFVSTEKDAVCLTDKYRDTPYLEDLIKLIPKGELNDDNRRKIHSGARPGDSRTALILIGGSKVDAAFTGTAQQAYQ